MLRRAAGARYRFGGGTTPVSRYRSGRPAGRSSRAGMPRHLLERVFLQPLESAAPLCVALPRSASRHRPAPRSSRRAPARPAWSRPRRAETPRRTRYAHRARHRQLCDRGRCFVVGVSPSNRRAPPRSGRRRGDARGQGRRFSRRPVTSGDEEERRNHGAGPAAAPAASRLGICAPLPGEQVSVNGGHLGARYAR